jgi:hypothetical protein
LHTGKQSKGWQDTLFHFLRGFHICIITQALFSLYAHGHENGCDPGHVYWLPRRLQHKTIPFYTAQYRAEYYAIEAWAMQSPHEN